MTLVHGVLTPKDVSHLQELFHGTDEDESGYVDPSIRHHPIP